MYRTKSFLGIEIQVGKSVDTAADPPPANLGPLLANAIVQELRTHLSQARLEEHGRTFGRYRTTFPTDARTPRYHP